MRKGDFRTVLVVDDESAMRHLLRLVLEPEGYLVTEAGSGREALQRLEEEPFDVVLCDIRMPEMDGLDFLRDAVDRDIPSTVIMMSAYGTVDTAIACMKQGAYDYIAKPFKPDEVVLTLRKAEERLRLRRENRRLQEELALREGQTAEPKLIYRSPIMTRVMELVGQVAGTNTPVLVLGETGTGKELIARTLHHRSGRKEKAFVAVNCAAIPGELLESELFGHAKGAFTGADRERPGLFRTAHEGTLFLDEIAELPLHLQPKLLRVLQEGEVRRVGDTRSGRVDVRIITATGRDLAQEIKAGRFRDDLFYRLAVLEVRVPALRERPEDIPLLARNFLEQLARRQGNPAPRLTPVAAARLKAYAWPGNVRELENLMERTLIFCREGTIDEDDLPMEIFRKELESADDLSLKHASRNLEEDFIKRALNQTGGNRTRAAEILEISLRSLIYKIKEYGLENE